MTLHHIQFHRLSKSFILSLLLVLPTSALATNTRASSQAFTTVPADTFGVEAKVTDHQMSKRAGEAAKLLGIEQQVKTLIELKKQGKSELPAKESIQLELSIIRKIMMAGLELRTTSARLDKEITVEYQALDKLSRERDAIVAITNNANFLQLSILSTIIDGPLEESRNHRRVAAGNRLNIVSGLTVGGLAGLAFLESRGGIRRSQAEPNLLGQTLGLDAPAEEKLPPMLWTYLNSQSPASDRSITRRELLLEYWKSGKVLPFNIDKQSTIEKVSVLGPGHSKWCESIKLINGRISMLFDLRAIIDLLNTGLVELLQELE